MSSNNNIANICRQILLHYCWLGLCLVSCDLEIEPEQTVTPEEFFSTSKNLHPALMGVYDACQDMFDHIMLLDAISDNATATIEEPDYHWFGQGTLNSVTGIIETEYANCFSVIQRSNLLLDNMDAPDEPESPTAEEKLHIEAEAKVLRAIAYMRLVYLFGDVPLMERPHTREEILALTRTPISEVIAFIKENLAEAISILEVAPLGEGRLTKLAALGFLARLQLYEARLGNIEWSEAKLAIELAEWSARQGNKGLFSVGDGTDGLANYEQQFFQTNEDNIEVIWSVKYQLGDKARNPHDSYYANENELVMSVLPELVAAFYTIDGLPITDTNSIYDPSNPYDNRDPRLEATVIVPGASYSNGSKRGTLREGHNSFSDTDFFLRKYIELERKTEVNEGTIDAIVMRYAELLLMLAEAENEVNGPTRIAQNAINSVRSRVAMPFVASDITKEEFRTEVIHERRVELAFEEQRWFDLITLGLAEEKIDGIENDLILNRDFVPEKSELFMIPQFDISLISGFTQNPGY
ncbi:RagB/SusD family nutrient uptake outer membrane protein [uncultured Polaribacter sp.]|uniref:RagB/SusD family nutrient uptake outer membrane protein n=1 Tax=uncultured Polaribacter sp. TaxID=174711 RepID=UPI002623AF15|nr:RagB/SusD family nutrient uptake outer membrane protein [uncultured Polaribacter sp.]